MHKQPPPHPVHSTGMADEADIGSGDKNPGQQETEAIIRQIPPLADDKGADKPGRGTNESTPGQAG